MIDTLYYGEHCSCSGHGHFHNESPAISFNVVQAFLQRIHNKPELAEGIDPGLWSAVVKVINEATVEGLSQSNAASTHDEEFYRALRHSNEVFAAFKVHSLAGEVAKNLLDSDGKLKPFSQWVDDVKRITSHHVGAWLRTEYDTAVIRAHNAADWREFERNKDVLPNLRWMPTTSPSPEGSHHEYWTAKLTLSIDDPFWNNHHPGDRWNCKCSLEATDDPVNRPADMDAPLPQKGLENNPGKDGHIFNDTHPYFPDKCSQCSFYKPGVKGRITTLFMNRKKDCYNCPYVDAAIPSEQREQRRNEYLEYKDNPLYKDVEFDAKSSGLKATHVEHSFDKKKGWYETTVQEVGFQNGHKVVLEKEDHTVLFKKNTEGTWDNMLFEIAGAETGTSNNIRQALKHCASKPNTEVAVLLFPNDNFNYSIFEEGYNKFYGLRGTSQYRKFKVIYCLNNKGILLIKKPE